MKLFGGEDGSKVTFPPWRETDPSKEAAASITLRRKAGNLCY